MSLQRADAFIYEDLLGSEKPEASCRIELFFSWEVSLTVSARVYFLLVLLSSSTFQASAEMPAPEVKALMCQKEVCLLYSPLSFWARCHCLM